MLTQEKLQEILNYVPETGELICAKIFSMKVKVGTKMGNLHPSGYIRITLMGRSYAAHRLVWLYHHGEFPKDMLDHIDGSKSNNKIENLRECSQAENQKNRKINSNNKSGYKGVHWDASRGKWAAQATIEGRVVKLGRFDSPEDAFKVADAAAKQYHGKFYRDTTEDIKV